MNVYAQQNDIFYYEITDNEVEIVGVDKATENVPIPEQINGLPVTVIGYAAFLGYYDSESKVIIPNQVKVIDVAAFLGVSDDTTIDITIPKSVIEIRTRAIGYALPLDYSEDCTYIDLAEKLSQTIIRGYTGTAAETYANENGFTFIALDDVTTTTITDTSTETQTTLSTTSTVVNSFYGDVNLDSKIDLCDAILLNQYVTGIIKLDTQQLTNSDCNSDKSVNSDDAICLMRFLVHLTNSLPELSL